jgi:hypothetical protein
MNAEQLSKLLESTQGHIRAFDSKAQIALGLDSLLAGFVGAELAKGFEFASWHFSGWLVTLLVISILSLAAAIGSAFFAIFTIVPRLHLQQPKSHFFFCHLVEMYGRNYHAAANSLIALNEDQVLHQLASQVHTNAIIGDAKASRSCRALYLMLTALILYIMALIPFCVIAYRSNTVAKIPAEIKISHIPEKQTP